MITERQIERLVERIVNKLDKANLYMLKQLGGLIKRIKGMSPLEAQQLVNIFKTGGDFYDIINQLSEYTGLSVTDIDEIFTEYAKKDYMFYKEFYRYRNKPFIEFASNTQLLKQTTVLSETFKKEMYNYLRPNVLGYTIRGIDGKTEFLGLRETYNRVLDEALLNVSQGEQTFDTAMSSIMEQIGESGLKTLDYQSGRSYRIDSMARMHLNEGLRTLHNENQKIIGEEFDYDGIEVTHHENAAPDHIDTVDGKQFALVDRIRYQIEEGMPTKVERVRGNQVWVDGKVYDDFNAVNESLDRQVSTLNCKHTTFSIILGVSKPQYTQEELDADKQKNLDGCFIDGKHYTLYETTQLQRQLERKVREQKDIQILAKASGNNELILKSQEKITQYTNKYHELSKVSGLPTYMERMKVSGYKRTKVKKNNITGNLYNSTNEWLEKATPNSHEIKIDKTYISNDNVKHPIKGKETAHLTPKDSVEYKRSQWIETTFGGEIHNVPRITDISNSKLSVHTPDFIWRKEKWDLKTPEPLDKKSNVIEAFAKKKKAKLQANNFIVDIKNTELTNKEIYNYTIDTMTKRKWLNKIMVVRGNKLLFIIEKK